MPRCTFAAAALRRHLHSCMTRTTSRMTLLITVVVHELTSLSEPDCLVLFPRATLRVGVASAPSRAPAFVQPARLVVQRALRACNEVRVAPGCTRAKAKHLFCCLRAILPPRPCALHHPLPAPVLGLWPGCTPHHCTQCKSSVHLEPWPGRWHC